MISPNESTLFFNGIIVAAVIANIWYVIAIRKLNKRKDAIKLQDSYIKHLEGLIEEYKRTTKRQNFYLGNDNNGSTIE